MRGDNDTTFMILLTAAGQRHMVNLDYLTEENYKTLTKECLGLFDFDIEELLTNPTVVYPMHITVD